MTAPFRFKAFTLVQEKSAFKAGTDSVLLGAWANVTSAQQVLDAGTGTGILALMVAQRNKDALITGIDTDAVSTEEAAFNFSKSPWTDRLHAIHIDLQSYAYQHPAKYSLAISNPPYFSNSLRPEDTRVLAARHQQTGWGKWMEAIATLLRPEGSYTTIIPVTEKTAVLQAAGLAGLHATRICTVHTRSDLPASRLLIEFSPDPMKGLERSNLVIYEKGEIYSEEFRKLTKEFYLSEVGDKSHFI
jgi:tRNA1Val (adenine37-N6)-methyltransferase